MRNFIFTMLISAGLALTAVNANAQESHHYVTKHPYATVGKRPPRPSPNHVWVGSEWQWKDNRYTEVQGHWETPPPGHKRWIAGHWTSTKRGSYWVPGHWS